MLIIQESQMQALQQLDTYYRFTKTEVFDKLHETFTSKMALTLTYHDQLSRELEAIQSHTSFLQQKRIKFTPFDQQFDCFINIFSQYSGQLKRECLRSKLMIDTLRDEAIFRLRQCELAYVQIQKQILKFGNEEMEDYDSKTLIHQKRITINKDDIQSYRRHCFVRMIDFAKEQSEEDIRIKYKREESEGNRKKYGEMCSEMMNYFEQTIPSFEQAILQQLQQLKQLQIQRAQTFQKLNLVFYQAESQKISLIQQLAALFNPDYHLLPRQLKKYPNLPKEVVIPKRGSISKLQYIKNAVHMSLRPFPHNQMIMNHRQSLSASLRKSRSTGIQEFGDDYSIQSSQIQIQPEQYEIFKGFFSQLRHNLQKSLPEENAEFLIKSQEALRHKAYRQLFVFFLYEQAKRSKVLKQQISNQQSQFLLKMIDICLNKCKDRYDTQTAIKLMLVSLQIKTVDKVQFYKKIDFSRFNIFQFWETTFIQNVYQYCQMMVVLYHEQLQALIKSNTRTDPKKSFIKLFEPIKSLFKKNEQKEEQHKDSIKQIYHQIIKNVFIIYFSLMRLLYVPSQICEKLKSYIISAVQRQKFAVQIQNSLKESIQKLGKRIDCKFKQLLCSQLVLQRALSKLIGTEHVSSEQRQKQSTSLSELISEWEKSA